MIITDLETKDIQDKDNVMYYISGKSYMDLLVKIDELECIIDELENKLKDLEQDLEDNYIHRPMSDYTGMCDKDFI